jgi:hypothetical protein
MDEKQSINSGEVGSLEDVLGENDPLLRPKLESEPDGNLGPDPEPEETPWEKRKRLYEENRKK